jgi:hypothetical protein
MLYLYTESELAKLDDWRSIHLLPRQENTCWKEATINPPRGSDLWNKR